MNPTSVIQDDHPKAPWRDEPGLGRAVIVGSVVAGALSLVVVTGSTLLSGMEWSAAVSLGLFVAFWGGAGFGSMIGGVLWATRAERFLEAEVRNSRKRPTDLHAGVADGSPIGAVAPGDHANPERMAS